jgi:hypothetical protein
VRSSLTRAGTLIAALCLGAAVFPAAPALASGGQDATSITSPAGPISYPLYDETAPGPAITVQGSASSGVSAVDIRCYGPPQFKAEELLARDVPVTGSGSFTVALERSALKFLPLCALRAVPAATDPSVSDASFTGPDVAPTSLEQNGTGAYVDTSTLTSNLWYQSATGCSLEETFLYPAPGQASAELFSCDAALLGANYAGAPRSDIQIDSYNAYGPESAHAIEEAIKASIPGAPQVSVGKSFDEATGQLELREYDPLVRCPSNLSPPTAASCPYFIPTGVTLERTWSTQDEEHVALASDSWFSTDGAAHSLSARYFTALQSDGSGQGSYDFPGAAGFAATSSGQQVSLPAGASAILYKASAGTPEGGDGVNPQGAIVYDPAPSEPLEVTVGSAGSTYSATEIPYSHMIPADGSYAVHMAYVQAYSMTEVRALAAAALAGMPPEEALSSATPTPLASPQLGDADYIAAADARVSALSVRAGGEVSFTVTCQGSSGPCTVGAALSTLEHLGHGRLLALTAASHTRLKLLVLAVRSVVIAPGRSERITLRLDAAGLRLLAHHRRLPAHLNVVLQGPGRTRSVLSERNLTLTPARRAHRR